jgi:hypothetical protein
LALAAITPAEDDAPKHPLDPALELGRAAERHILQEVRDYSCKLVKIDRIDGDLREPEEIRVKVRIPKEEGGVVVQKYSIFLEYLSPSKLKGRKVLFIEGENDGKMFVKVGGRAPSFLHVKDYPDSARVLSTSRYPVTDLGFQHLAKTLLDRAERNRDADPDGKNTDVSITPGILVEGRSCTRIRVLRPERQAEQHHIDELYIDDTLRVPVRMLAFDWPEAPGGEPVLLESYTYTDVRLNVGLPDSDFARSAVK